MRHFGVGLFELLIIGMVMLLIFGGRLPSAMQSLSNGFQQLRCN
jgi:Sec-independent protein translocase protein TatA